MSSVRQVLAVFLSLFLALPAFAEDKPKFKKKIGGNEYPYFKLGVRPVDKSEFVNWDKECVVVSSEDSPPSRLYYTSQPTGGVKISNLGIIRAGEPIVIDAVTGFALRPRICGNWLQEPLDWVVPGVKNCKPTPAAVVAEASASVENPEKDYPSVGMFKSFPVPTIEAKKLNLNLPQEEQKSAVSSPGGEKDKKSYTWAWIAGGTVGAVGLGFLLKSLFGGSKSSGGPAKDPKN